jgi:hypothetical protein
MERPENRLKPLASDYGLIYLGGEFTNIWEVE